MSIIRLRHFRIASFGRGFALAMVFAAAPLAADSYHNVNGFFGERAAGLGGAFTAISEDPSGAFYNPAGLAFSYNNYISLSASTYREFKKDYENVFGVGLGYSRESRTYIPNFFGAIKDLGKFKFAFSIVNPITEAFDQADQIVLPHTGADLFNYRNDFTEDNLSFMAGPSVGYALSEKMSVGATLYYTFDSARITSTQLVQRNSGSYFHVSTHDRRRTIGLLPVLGYQYMPSTSWSLGVSYRKQLVTGVNRRVSLIRTDSAATDRSQIRLVESTENASAIIQSSAVVAGPPVSGAIPRVDEWRAGVAWFKDKYMMISVDAIRTSGYQRGQDRTLVDVGQSAFVFRDSEIPYLTRIPTLNFAVGLEFYLSDNLAIRAGYFTNKANSREIDWLEATVATEARNNGLDTISIGTAGLATLAYTPLALEALERFEHADMQGYSLGVSWEDSSSSVSLTYTVESGKGMSQIDSSQLPQTMRLRSFSFYIVASTKQ